MSYLQSFDVYADYGTFALTPSSDFEFPTDVSSEDLERGYRVVGENLVIYLPELDNFEVVAEVYRDAWPLEVAEPDMSFVAEIPVQASELRIYGLLDDVDGKPSFEIAQGTYECSCRGFFSDGGQRFQLLLRRKGE